MKKLTNDFAQKERECNRIDWRVWTEIRYLDSPTDHREYLPRRSHLPTMQRDNSLALLDRYERSLWS